MGASVSPSTAANQTVAWSIAPGGNGAASISSGGLLTASLLGTVTVVATANDGTGVTGSEQVTINLPTYTYSTPTYTLTYNAGAHGSISGTSPQTVDQSASGTAVTAVPDWVMSSWRGTTAQPVNPRIDTDIQGNINVIANFSLISTSTLSAAGTTALAGGDRATAGAIGHIVAAAPGDASIASRALSGPVRPTLLILPCDER